MRTSNFNPSKIIRIPTEDVVQNIQQNLGRVTLRRPLAADPGHELGFEATDARFKQWILTLRNGIAHQVSPFGGQHADKIPFSYLSGAYLQIQMKEEFDKLSSSLEQLIADGRFRVGSLAKGRV